MKEQLTIVKVGGKIIEDDRAFDKLIYEFGKIAGRKLLVHGGGRTATKMAGLLGVETTMIDGRRVTDHEMLNVVTMVYGGLVNKQLVSKLQACGVNALGLTGADGNVIQSKKRGPIQGIDYGFVGDVETVDTLFISQLLLNGVVPVFAPLTHDGNGAMLNTNADTIASVVAKSLSSSYSVKLYYCFEYDGVLENPKDSNSVIRSITELNYRNLLTKGVVSGGMIPKLDNAFESLKSGVKEVVITSVDNLSDSSKGTHITLSE